MVRFLQRLAGDVAVLVADQFFRVVGRYPDLNDDDPTKVGHR